MLLYFWLSVYIFTAFASSLPCPIVEVGAVVMGIVVTGVMACRGGDGGLRGGVSRNIDKVVVVILSGVNWGIRFYGVLCFKLCINMLVSMLDLKVPSDCSL